MNDDRLQLLEEKIAHLERHVTEQDKAMLEFADELAGLRRDLARLRERNSGDAPSGEVDERPPHY